MENKYDNRSQQTKSYDLWWLSANNLHRQSPMSAFNAGWNAAMSYMNQSTEVQRSVEDVGHRVSAAKREI